MKAWLGWVIQAEEIICEGSEVGKTWCVSSTTNGIISQDGEIRGARWQVGRSKIGLTLVTIKAMGMEMFREGNKTEEDSERG